MANKEIEKKKIYKEMNVEVKEIEGEDRTLEFTITTETKDRDKDTISSDGWILDNFLKNPVVLWAHKYDQPAVGKALEVRKDGNGLKSRVEFATADIYPFADQVYKLYKNGYMKAVSVGFIPIEWEENKEGGYNFKKQELLEFSLVPVPANPEALVSLAVKGLEAEREEKAVITYARAHPNGTPLAPEDESWDAAAEVRQAEVSDLRVMCAWYDSENPDVKGSYKLPHHKAAGQHSCVWRGVAAAMAALMGARGGVDIPDADRRGVYNHLVRHYEEFEKEPPEFRSYDLDDPLELINLISMCYNIKNEPTKELNDGKKNGEGKKEDKELEELRKKIREEVDKIWQK